jgi:hypothetical protein
MKLIELIGQVYIDNGAPMPLVISNDTELFVTFYGPQHINSDIPVQLDPVVHTGTVIIHFDRYLKYAFGMPGNESIFFHRYTKLGLSSFSFFELEDSPMIKELQDIDRQHPYYNGSKWDNYKHFILTFHDNMFECVAQGFHIEHKNTALFDRGVDILSKLYSK